MSGDSWPSRGRRARGFLAILGLGAIGVLALVLTTYLSAPETFELAAAQLGVTVEVVVLVSILQSLVLVAIAAAIGVVLADRVGFESHVYRYVTEGQAVVETLAGELRPAAAVGVGVGALLVVADFVAPTPVVTPPDPTIEALLASLPFRVLYGGITEEVLLRWGFMTFVAFVIWRIFARSRDRPGAVVAWVAIVLSAVAFGVGHLPAAAAAYGGLTGEVLAFIVGANTIAGVGFGWLYWRHSLEAAMIAHGLAHVVAVAASTLFLLT